MAVASLRGSSSLHRMCRDARSVVRIPRRLTRKRPAKDQRVTRLPQLLTTTVAFAALALPASALASPEAVIRDCGQDGSLDGSYSNRDLREARANLPTDVDEYSDCREIIGAAIATDAGKGAIEGPTSPGGANTPSPAEHAARSQDQKEVDRMAAAREARATSTSAVARSPRARTGSSRCRARRTTCLSRCCSR